MSKTLLLPDGLRMERLERWHIQSILPLEQEIRQFTPNLLSDEQRTELIRQFIRWDEQKLCRNKVVLNEQEEPVAYFFLALEPEIIAKFYAAEPMRRLKTCAYLAQIAVHPEQQGQGLGSSLMKVIESLCLMHHKQRLLLEVNSTSSAYRWYRKQNFEEIGAQVFMSKNLS